MSVDGHKTKGNYGFEFDEVGRRVDAALVLCRWLQFASAMLLFGISIFQSTLAPAALAHALDRGLRQLSKAGAIVVLATMIVCLLLASGEIGEGWTDVWNPSAIGSVLLDTDFGRVWQWRVGFAVVLIGVLVFGRNDHWLPVALLAALTLGSVGFVGHAVMRVGVLGWLNRLSHVIHLLAAGFWLGSLVPSSPVFAWRTIRSPAQMLCSPCDAFQASVNSLSRLSSLPELSMVGWF